MLESDAYWQAITMALKPRDIKKDCARATKKLNDAEASASHDA